MKRLLSHPVRWPLTTRLWKPSSLYATSGGFTVKGKKKKSTLFRGSSKSRSLGPWRQKSSVTFKPQFVILKNFHIGFFSNHNINDSVFLSLITLWPLLPFHLVTRLLTSSCIIMVTSPPPPLSLCRYWLCLHCDRLPAEYLLHRHPGLGSLLPIPGRIREKWLMATSFSFTPLIHNLYF